MAEIPIAWVPITSGSSTAYEAERAPLST